MDLEAPVGHVVHLVRTFEGTGAPETIGFGTRVRPAGRWALWALISLATVGTAILLVNVWISDSQWWFNLIFILPGFFLFGCVVALAESTRRSRREDILAQRWTQTWKQATSTEGRITDRRVALLDDGGVSSFALIVTDAAGSQVHARWYRSNPDSRGETLLQTQIPAIGSGARIWAVGIPDWEAPIVVEALDPSIVH